MLSILVTGGAGFIGFILSKRLLELGHSVVVFDNLNPYYDPKLKKQRLAILNKFKNFSFESVDLSDYSETYSSIREKHFEYVYHLAAQAGVRYSFVKPREYLSANVEATFNLLEALKSTPPKRFIFGSTSSVYGDSQPIPQIETNNLNPIQFYAESKILAENLCNYYSRNYAMEVLIFRLFTVYGPWGRPDMAFFKFTTQILEKEPMDIYNNGDHYRSFTYVDDVVHYLVKALNTGSFNGCETFNLGNPTSVSLKHIIKFFSNYFSDNLKIRYLPKQDGDMFQTQPDITKLISKFGDHTFKSIDDGLIKFLLWHQSNYPLHWKK